MRRRRVGGVDIALRVWGGVCFAFLFLPIVFIVIYSFNTGRLLVAWKGFGFSAYSDALNDPTIRGAVEVSLKSAVGAAIVATVLGTLGGLALARRPGKWVPIFIGILGLTLVTPEIVDAVSLLPWFVSLGTDWHVGMFDNGLIRLVIGQSLFAVAVVTFIVRARLAGLDESLEEAAADLYATPRRRFTQVTLPLMMPAVLAGSLLSFTLSLDNTIISSFIQVSGSTPWPVYVLSAVRSALRPQIAAMSTIMLGFTLVALALVALVLRRSGETSTDIARTMAGA